MQTSYFHDDRPITELTEDQLGYTKPARHLAESILNLSAPEGFVIGLEGEWGSGKTSFVNLIIKVLQSHPQPPEIIKFSPWLISTRSALLGELFQSIAMAALKIPLDQDSRELSGQTFKNKILSRVPWRRDANRRELIKAIDTFGGHISRLAKYAGLAEVFGLAGAGIIGNVLNASSEAFSRKSMPTLDKEKEILQSELRKLTRKIVVFIDDLDRLEPAEAVEIVRLVRAVIDLPNIIYVLCYSRKILVPSLSKALSLSDGEKYLDKIVQVTFSVPKPEDFDLRRIFKNKVEEVFQSVLQSKSDIDSAGVLERLNEVIDQEGGRTLLTPRDIARVVNALQVYAIPILEKIDIADMTWLQLVRIRNNKIYEWIEEYICAASAVYDGAIVSEHYKQKLIDEILSLVDKEGTDKAAVISMISSILPGIHDSYIERDGKNRWSLFEPLNSQEASKSMRDCRIASRQHFRFYFALTKPSGALDDDEYRKFLDLCEIDIKEANELFSLLSTQKRPQGGVFSEAIVDRLIQEIGTVPIKSISGIIFSFAASMDIIAKNTEAGYSGKYWVWSTALSVARLALKRLSEKDRSDILDTIFKQARALGWLTYILREETYSHGLQGDRANEGSDILFTAQEFSSFANSMRDRYRKLTVEDVKKIPKFINVLFGWIQLGDDAATEVKHWIQNVISSDEGFIALMERMTSWTAINGEVYYPLRTENIAVFCDVIETDNRLKDIAQREHDPLALQARKLLEARKEQ